LSTNCIFPPELDDKQLLAFLDDPAANQEIASHIEKCPYCRQKAEALDRFQKRLKSRLYRSTCPPPEELGEFHLRLLPANQVLQIAQHLRKCPYCVEEITGLEKELQTDREPKLSSIEPLKRLFAQLVRGGAGTVSGHALTGIRGDTTSSPIFEVDDIVISLDVEPDPDGQISVQGLLVAGNQDEWTGATIAVKQSYMMPLTAQVDDLGSFTLKSLYPSPTQIAIRSLKGMEVETETVQLGT
jgi:hypothetical protein